MGAALTCPVFTGVDLDPAVRAALSPSISKDSFGPALQAGLDIALGGGLYLNLDLKKVWIRTDVKSFGTKVGTFKVDPVLLGIGLGCRF